MLLYLAKYSTYQCRVWALIDTADTATHIPSFTAPAYLVTESYGGKILDSFSIKLLNRFTYLPETQAPGLFEQALAINVAVFTVSSTQARVFERFSNLERSIRKNSTLRSALSGLHPPFKSATADPRACALGCGFAGLAGVVDIRDVSVRCTCTDSGL